MNPDQDINLDELNSKPEIEEPVKELLHREADTPLFLRNNPDGQKGDALDEKDKTEE